MWLAATPSHACSTVLSPIEFRDKLRDRLKLLNTPSHYNGCTTPFSVHHALSCKVGGLVHSRHDEGRDAIGCLVCASFQPSNVRDEPIISPCRDLEWLESFTLTEPNTGLTAEHKPDRGTS